MSPAQSSLRRRCTGVAFAHDPTFFSIAKARTRLRRPLCGAEVDLTATTGGEGR